MKIDSSKLDLIPVPQNIPLVKLMRNMYAVKNEEVHYYFHSCGLLEDEDNFHFIYEEIEGVVGKDDSQKYDTGHFGNLIKLSDIVRNKIKLFPYFIKHKYEVTYSLKYLRNLGDFEHPFGYGIQRHVYLGFLNYFVKTGVCDMDEEKNACAVNFAINEITVKMSTSFLELLEPCYQNLDFMVHFIPTIEIKARKINF